MPLRLITGPVAEPITLAEAKLHVKQDHASDDTLITDLIVAARERAEYLTMRALMPQTWELVLNEFPKSGVIMLPRPPFAALTSVKYYEAPATERTLDAATYLVATSGARARIVLAHEASWPDVSLRPDEGIAIRFTAGYANAGAIPRGIKLLMLSLIAHWYGRREAVTAESEVGTPYEVPEYLKALAWQYRPEELAA